MLKRLFEFKLGIKLESDLAMIAYLFKELFNILFLTEAVSIARALDLLRGNRQKIQVVFRLEDNLLEGKSYFLQEVQVIKKMLDLSSDGNHHFLLDELFKGTHRNAIRILGLYGYPSEILADARKSL